MVDTTIYIGGFPIHEPVTAITDFLIAIICFIYFIRLSAVNEVVNNWRNFFLFISLSTLCGGCSHAFFVDHTGLNYKSIWLPMQFLNGFAIYCAQQATLISALKDSKKIKAWLWSYRIQLVVYFIVLSIVQNYFVTIMDNAIALIPIMIVHFNAGEKEAHYNFVGYGIAISFITAIVHGLKISLHAYFNHNDLAHVFIITSLTVIYFGIKRKIISV